MAGTALQLFTLVKRPVVVAAQRIEPTW